MKKNILLATLCVAGLVACDNKYEGPDKVPVEITTRHTVWVDRDQVAPTPTPARPD